MGAKVQYLEVAELLPWPLGEEPGVRRHCELATALCGQVRERYTPFFSAASSELACPWTSYLNL